MENPEQEEEPEPLAEIDLHLQDKEIVGLFNKLLIALLGMNQSLT